MRNGLLSFGVLFLAGALHGPVALAHEDESRVAIELEEITEVQAGKVSLNFELIDLKNKIVLSDADLSIIHTKKLHLFIFDPALKEFRHEHPEYSNSKWHVTTDLSVSGNYWTWVQGEITKDGEEFTSNTRLKVSGGTQANPLPPELGDVRTGTDSLSQVVLSKNKIVKNKMVMLTLRFSRKDGTKPQLSPYLGEMAHVIGVLEDGDSLVHIHPMNTDKPNELMLHAEFPQSGHYRLWVQFIDEGVLKTVPLSVQVLAK